MKKFFANKFVQLLLRDALEAAVAVEPLVFSALKSGITVKVLVSLAADFGVALVAVLRRQYLASKPGA